jgi:hypothetical protein
MKNQNFLSVKVIMFRIIGLFYFKYMLMFNILRAISDDDFYPYWLAGT